MNQSWKPRYSGPGKTGICKCGHIWDDHHLGVALGPGYPEYYLPQECEFYGWNEAGGLDADGHPHCFQYEDDPDAKPGDVEL